MFFYCPPLKTICIESIANHHPALDLEKVLRLRKKTLLALLSSLCDADLLRSVHNHFASSSSPTASTSSSSSNGSETTCCDNDFQPIWQSLALVRFGAVMVTSETTSNRSWRERYEILNANTTGKLQVLSERVRKQYSSLSTARGKRSVQLLDNNNNQSLQQHSSSYHHVTTIKTPSPSSSHSARRPQANGSSSLSSASSSSLSTSSLFIPQPSLLSAIESVSQQRTLQLRGETSSIDSGFADESTRFVPPTGLSAVTNSLTRDDPRLQITRLSASSHHY